MKCKLPPKAKEMPTLNPTACIVGVNSSGLWEVRILKDHCYMAADDLIFYCAINQRAFGANPPQQNTNHADKSFTLNITNNAPTVKVINNFFIQLILLGFYVIGSSKID